MFKSIGRRWRVATAASLLAAVAALGASTSVVQAAPSPSSLLTQLAKTHPNRKVEVIVQFRSGTSQRRARALVRSRHGKLTARLPAVNGLAVKLRARDAVALRRSKRVRKVTLNTSMRSTSSTFGGGRLATTYPKTVGADKLWAAGITGKGVGVAVIDSGISGSKPDFKGATGSTRITANVISSGATRPGDDVGHGTHVAGILAGNSFNRDVADASYGAYVGIAPEASVIALKVADDAGAVTMVDVITALQFTVDHKDELGIRVVNLSLSSDTPGSYLDDPINAAVEFVWHSGIVVVVAAGNRGAAADAVQYPPGNDPYAISVGATDELGTPDPSDDVTTPESSRGVTQDGATKPDVLAPGAHIVAPLAMGSAFQALCPSCVVAGEYLRIGGTSMAAPVVAGAAALLLQARPDLNPDQVKGLLTANTGVARTGLGLGTAESFAILAGTTVTNTGPSTINGNLGLSPGTAVTGFGPGRVTGTAYAADAIALKAQSDLTTAYDDAAARTPAVPAPADLGGLTLTPGVYRNASSLGLTGALTLDAQGDPNAVFVLQAGSTLTTGSASQVRLVNGAQACNVFWKVGSSATLGTGTVLAGNILALTSISINDGVTLQGRALARNGAVTLINDAITAAHCAAGAGGSAAPARELDVAAALAADPGVGANQHLWPNRAVEAALVQARLDPTRANWTKGTWTKGTWTKGTWSKGTWSKGTWSGAERGSGAP
jgi:serine protease AprX